MLGRGLIYNNGDGGNGGKWLDQKVTFVKGFSTSLRPCHCRWDHLKSQEAKEAARRQEESKLGWEEYLWWSRMLLNVLKTRSSVHGATGRWDLVEIFWSYEGYPLHQILETQPFLSFVLFSGCYKANRFFHCTTLLWCTMLNPGRKPSKLWEIRIKRNKPFFD